jgi:hypothetical protein
MLYTTLNKINDCHPCEDRWQHLLKSLGKTKADDERLPFSVILDANGLNDALWCCRSAPEYDREWRLYAIWCARRVQHLMKDERSIHALDVAERYANGAASDEELIAARDAAWDAAWIAAMGAASAAAWAAVRAASRDAARAAAWAAVRAASRDAQAKRFREIVK